MASNDKYISIKPEVSLERNFMDHYRRQRIKRMGRRYHGLPPYGFKESWWSVVRDKHGGRDSPQTLWKNEMGSS
ncbi:MAG: hypothetical protein PHW97_10435 [Fermentimonas sp.]|nr:hypothetical protein [Fermentimonas sp.]